MQKLWRLVAHEYRRHVLNKGFVFAVVSVPLLILATVGLGMLTDRLRYNALPVGYVDESGWLMGANAPVAGEVRGVESLGQPSVDLIGYSSRQAAKEALESRIIQAYYILADDYEQTQRVELVYIEPPGRNADADLKDMIRTQLLAGRPPEVVRRVLEGTNLVVRSPDGVREQSERSPLGFLLPLFLALAIIILFMSTSTTLAQGLAEEKENRTIEVMVTTVSPGELIGSKVLAVSAMGLTEVVAWAALVALALGGASRVFGIAWLADIHIHPRTLGTILAIAVPSYVLFSALMLTVAAILADPQESQQLGGILSMCFVAPFWAIMPLVEQPNSVTSLVLSLFPLTSLTSYCLLAAFHTIPLWRFLASLAILVASATGATWLAAHAFRAGMLRYGQRVPWRELLARPRRPREPAGSAGGAA